MSILDLTGIAQQFGDKILYEDLELHLNKGTPRPDRTKWRRKKYPNKNYHRRAITG